MPDKVIAVLDDRYQRSEVDDLLRYASDLQRPWARRRDALVLFAAKNSPMPVCRKADPSRFGKSTSLTKSWQRVLGC